ncbi:MAG: metallophosphoesterase [Phycisphaerales bacterium]|nr:metallophosphoesterase [Phycisphaerales bacterium]
MLNITDLHVIPEIGGEIYDVDSYLSLVRVVESGLTHDPDLVIVTGDMVEHGDTESYKRVRQLLNSIDLPVFVLPGNHDSPNHMTNDLCGENIHYVDFYDLDGWRLIFLDSHVEGKGYGELSADQQLMFQKALEQSSSRHVLVALHHTPIILCPSFNCQLNGAREFLEDLSSWPNVRAVIAGHAHVECDARYKGIYVMTTPATSAQCIHEPATTCKDLVDFQASHHLDPSKHGFRILDLESDGTFRSEVHWVLNPDTKVVPS